MKLIRIYSPIFLLAALLATTSCNKDDELIVVPPAEENNPEVLTDIKLLFTNSSDANDVVEARAQDADGIGVEELEVLDPINLDTSKTYILAMELFNNLKSPGEDIGEEIEEEDDEHQFFFSFNNDAFADPMGDGNIDNPADSLRYNDMDDDGNPVGLSTTWTTSSTQLSGGKFKVRLQHQPGVKTATSGSNDGDTDFELEFVLNIQ